MTELQGAELIEAVQVLTGLVMFAIILVGASWFKK